MVFFHNILYLWMQIFNISRTVQACKPTCMYKPEYFDTFNQSLFRSKVEKYAFQRVKHAYKYLMIRKKDKERACHCKNIYNKLYSLENSEEEYNTVRGERERVGFFSGCTATKSLYFVWLSWVISRYSF